MFQLRACFFFFCPCLLMRLWEALAPEGLRSKHSRQLAAPDLSFLFLAPLQAAQVRIKATTGPAQNPCSSAPHLWARRPQVRGRRMGLSCQMGMATGSHFGPDEKNERQGELVALFLFHKGRGTLTASPLIALSFHMHFHQFLVKIYYSE